MKAISKMVLVAVSAVFLAGCFLDPTLRDINLMDKADAAWKAGDYAKALSLRLKFYYNNPSNQYAALIIGDMYNGTWRGGGKELKNENKATEWYRISMRVCTHQCGIHNAKMKEKIARIEAKRAAVVAGNQKRRAKQDIDARLARGGDINERDADSNTVLHLAAEHRLGIELSKIIEAGADVNIINKRADTPLHLAARAKWRYAVKVLLQAGADPTKTNVKGETAMAIAVESGDEDLVGEFVLAGSDTTSLAGLSEQKAQRDEAKRQLEIARERVRQAEAEARQAEISRQRVENFKGTVMALGQVVQTAAAAAQTRDDIAKARRAEQRANEQLAAARRAAEAAERQAAAAEQIAAGAAQQQAARKSYSAVAEVSNNKGWGIAIAIGHEAILDATNTALRGCRAHNKGPCTIAYRWEGPGCGAIAKGGDGSGAWAISNSKISAERNALNECGGSCWISDRAKCATY